MAWNQQFSGKCQPASGFHSSRGPGYFPRGGGGRGHRQYMYADEFQGRGQPYYRGWNTTSIGNTQRTVYHHKERDSRKFGSGQTSGRSEDADYYYGFPDEETEKMGEAEAVVYQRDYTSHHQRGRGGYRSQYGYGYSHSRYHSDDSQMGLNFVAHPTIARRGMPYYGGPFRGGYSGRLTANQRKLHKTHQTRAYWQQLQDNLQTNDLRKKQNLDLKSDEAVGLTLDNIIEKAMPQ